MSAEAKRMSERLAATLGYYGPPKTYDELLTEVATLAKRSTAAPNLEQSDAPR